MISIEDAHDARAVALAAHAGAQVSTPEGVNAQWYLLARLVVAVEALVAVIDQ